jgi:hypothetical protein
VRLVVRVSAWIQEQLWQPRGADGVAPAHITVLTSDGTKTLTQRSRKT